MMDTKKSLKMTKG